MPDIKTDDGCIIHVEVEGPQNAPVLMLSNSLGTNLHMWDDQAPAWSRQFRLVRYDRRGHGQSSVPKGPYPMERLGRDVLAVIDALGIAKISWCGLSMGGMVGQWLGANAPARVDKLVLSKTSSYFVERWFTKEFRDRNPQAMARMREMFLATKSEGYIGCGEGIRDMDHRPLLAKITAPTLVIAGKHDPATPLEANEFIRQHIPAAQIAVLDAAHIANIEQPQIYADTVLKFLLN